MTVKLLLVFEVQFNVSQAVLKLTMTRNSWSSCLLFPKPGIARGCDVQLILILFKDTRTYKYVYEKLVLRLGKNKGESSQCRARRGQEWRETEGQNLEGKDLERWWERCSRTEVVMVVRSQVKGARPCVAETEFVYDFRIPHWKEFLS